ncbi:30S ribosomal protein S3 [Candidatus Beckwithbacteria bacterium CG22_combo_CG10-13_8_21_14_all_01_47_9]|uniref:Small ribosomal subunit protein uS3 n=4 Tax=Candidatus Beckwithiibacteriota TaxID=1752726 RepID=A0A2H0E197_9BACT|nr:MAG: 30S ribosomal protein S3 [Candidatus Beckwithbacteria bacterium CG1_02_47_37]PIP88001.1 MAG: 30S ribosomal protein S3 [Candidatus Beckwithbacteria bacterium CG22_combo_CG10-13_8_21_14_all_01_47_9]PJA21774.1 MAG: 30S ribosomal protein S3 [Candidatus Beckwithbacteria bacterium CG_4_10_14_0_2_um_filter_47_25]PJC66508.1 MAG: 30S ribosomal protein S3 [Candidatus Beckwithbacteria bacterium CG_4_9_14_0_2_um_filter_47_11]
MGQKVNPKSFRLGSLYTWSSNWYAKKGDYAKFLVEDFRLRQWLLERLKLAGITEIKIDRSINTIKITLSVARPGVVIGRGGSGLEQLKKEISAKLKTPKLELQVVEVKNPDLSARLIGLRLADQLLRRYPHRRAIAQALEKTMASGAKGVKILLSGRINGAEISRKEKYFKGSMPLSTLRSDIDYFQQPAFTKMGYVGIKIWVYTGEKVSL